MPASRVRGIDLQPRAACGRHVLTAETRVRRYIDASAALLQFPLWRLPDGTTYPPGVWLEALVMQESSGDPTLRRYEAHHDRVSDGDHAGADDVRAEDDASWGPMQCLGSNVKNILGMDRDARVRCFDALSFWPLGMAFGLWVLRETLEHAQGDVARALARYNGGTRGDELVMTSRGKQLRRQEYVDAVLRWADRVVADRYK